MATKRTAGPKREGAIAKPATAQVTKPHNRRPGGIDEVGARTAILEAALLAFSQDGFDGASLPKIARAANVGHPLIHYYFGSKENLWRETVQYAFGGLLSEVAMIEAASRDLSPLDRFRVLVRAFTLFAARHPSHLGLIMAETRAKTERLTWLQANFTHAFVGRLRKLLAEAQAAKQIRDVPIDHLDVIVIGSVVLYFSVNFQLPSDVSAEQLAAQHADAVLDAILEGITP
jgi:AcrR family transcriptional regulator